MSPFWRALALYAVWAACVVALTLAFGVWLAPAMAAAAVLGLLASRLLRRGELCVVWWRGYRLRHWHLPRSGISACDKARRVYQEGPRG